MLKILIWHGYLLAGTGSNVYTRQLAREFSRAGHDVHVFCQDPDPGRYDLAGATIHRPDIGQILPVFVLDDYEHLEPKLLQDTSPEERARVIEASASAIRQHLPADLVLTNHALLGGPVGVEAGERFAVKIHGSELEFSIRDNPELTLWARTALAGARDVIVGSEHVREALTEILGPGPHLSRIRVIPPGVDVELFRPREREEALSDLLAAAREDPPNPGNADERLPDAGNAARFERFFADERPPVLYFGKLSNEKGVHTLIDAARAADARLVVAGFGKERSNLEGQATGVDALFTGALEHRHLAPLIPLSAVAVTPSVFPEAFGMVAAEAAAAGVPPLVADHSGLATIADGVAARYPREYARLTRFEPGRVDDLARALTEILSMPSSERASLRAGARQAAVEDWSWGGVAREIISAW